MAWRLSRWISMALVVSTGAVLLRNWRAPWAALCPAVLFLAYGLLLRWSARRGYVLFEPEPAQGGPEGASGPGRFRLLPEERVPVRATGWFTVEGKAQYYVDVEADLTRTGLGEYIVLGRVAASRFLLLGRLPDDLIGWWYMFFLPGTIRAIEAGRLYTAFQPQFALRLLVTGEGRGEQALYLAFDGTTRQRQVWGDLTEATRSAASMRPRGT